MADTGEKTRESLQQVEAVFTPGRLRDKCDEMRRLRETGATRLFEGAVRWSVMLTDHDKRLRGESESLDAAFGDMARCLDLLADDHGEETPVVCAIAQAGDGA
ncbi:MAG: hypothetical protein KGL10_06325 [Alphaproteobacteria bacterium]|nr:hypothetical protein [Alphaproteobacteria bacterium]MDE2336909.1 hypothetical protein [Alphaproteobacteria bacterium]